MSHLKGLVVSQLVVVLKGLWSKVRPISHDLVFKHSRRKRDLLLIFGSLGVSALVLLMLLGCKKFFGSRRRKDGNGTSNTS